MAKEFNLFLDRGPQKFELLINGGKEQFDLYLGRRTTECDIIVYSIPYRDGITAVSRLVLDSQARESMYKLLSAGSSAELDSWVAQMVMQCVERFCDSLTIQSKAEFDLAKSLALEPLTIELAETGPLPMTAAVFIQAGSGIELGLAALETAYAVVHTEDRLEVAATVEEVVRKLETAVSAAELAVTARETLVKPAGGGTSSIVIDCSAGLSVRRYRLVHEMDDDTLTTYDQQTLDEVDYITL